MAELSSEISHPVTRVWFKSDDEPDYVLATKIKYPPSPNRHFNMNEGDGWRRIGEEEFNRQFEIP